MDNNSASPMAIGALVAGILSCIGCNMFLCIPSIAAIALGKIELGKIDNGESAEAGRTFAKVGMILGIVMLILTSLGLVIQGVLFGLQAL